MSAKSTVLITLTLAACAPEPDHQRDAYPEASLEPEDPPPGIATGELAASPGQDGAVEGDVSIDAYHCDGTPAKRTCVRADGSVEPDHGDDWAKTIEYIQLRSGQCGAGCTIRLGRRHHAIRSRVTFCRAVRLVGVGGGATPASLPGSRLVIHPGGSLKVAFTHECEARGALGSGAGTLIEHLGICRPNAADPTRCGTPLPTPAEGDTTDALLIEATATVRDVRIRGPFRHGIHITADANSRTCRSGCADGQWTSDASNWRLDDVVIDYTTDRGVYIHGGDTNSGVAINLSVKKACLAAPAPCAFLHDDGFIGNTHLGHHLDGTDSPPSKGYLLEGDSHVIVGAYAETGFTSNEVAGTSVAVGGKTTFSGPGLTIGWGRIRHARLEYPRILKDSTGATKAYLLFDIPAIGARVPSSEGFYVREYDAGAPTFGLFGSRFPNTNLGDRGWAWLYDESPDVRKETFMPKLKGQSLCDYQTMTCL